MLLAAASAALLSSALGQAAKKDTFKRPNEDTECGSEAMDFLAYGESLGLTCGANECEYKVSNHKLGTSPRYQL